MTRTVRTAALSAVIVVCAALTAACDGHTGAADGGGQPATATVTPAPSATGLTELTRIVDAAQSAAAAADSDAAKD